MEVFLLFKLYSSDEIKTAGLALYFKLLAKGNLTTITSNLFKEFIINTIFFVIPYFFHSSIGKFHKINILLLL